MSNKAYFANFTPISISSTTTRSGAKKLKARGIIASSRGQRKLTIIAFGRLHDKIAPSLEEGRPVLLKGYYENVTNLDGSRGGSFFKPFVVIRSYDLPTPANENTPHPANDTCRSVAGHVREGHFRWQRYGKGLALRKRIWVEDCKVNGGIPHP